MAAARAIELAPELPAARMAMANVFYRTRDYPRALELTLGVFGDAPSYPEVPWRIATIYRRQGRWDESTRLFERAVELDPMNGERLTNAYVYGAVGDADLAVETLDRLLAVPTRYTPTWLRFDPFLAPLRGHPGFERLVRESGEERRRPIVS